jgi:hypothetical protein
MACSYLLDLILTNLFVLLLLGTHFEASCMLFYKIISPLVLGQDCLYIRVQLMNVTFLAFKMLFEMTFFIEGSIT